MTAEELKHKIVRKAWEDANFKAKLLSDPKRAINEAFGIEVPGNIKLQALEETDNQFYLVVPKEPSAVLVAAGVKNEPTMGWE
ncbi:hypothetical protein SD70_17840 [Gordoniibacillus kamchatkensis]|uniref:Nitrile hydratase alpha/Thiocyanate hydrolase gamma domain-containing protein n=1 Tax=Gordoniibacillus kamchatkensis TaxID=1590651 RepID=A0ABR5AFL6_9BACL|nr:NHLP leader peptide family RiPP precursor [Paenibacillus sp. VKM B-2647]KIL39771.1 hypothetical protein SD70_17840 [Paenibacillus sp. VKM B-2647]